MSGVVVCAYSEVGHACLEELLELGADVRLVVTHDDAPGEAIWFSSVVDRARAAGIPVIQPFDVNAPDSVARIAETEPDLLFSFYFRQMIKTALLGLPRLGALNLHGSLLPNYRGRAPVNWVLVHGEQETGVTLHYMDPKPDHGDIVARRAVPITRDDTALTLTRKLAAAGRAVLREMLPRLLEGTAPRQRQDHSRSHYFGGRKPADGEIDWSAPAETARNLVRAVTRPWPGAFTWYRDRKLLIWRAETRTGNAAAGEIVVAPDATVCVGTGDGLLELLEVSEDGDAESISAAEWLRVSGAAPGKRLGR
jgi:methionyl-tRNA formyltransferase